MIKIFKLFVLVIGKDFNNNAKCYMMYLSEHKSMRSAIKAARIYRDMHLLDTFRIDYWKDYNLFYSRQFEIFNDGSINDLQKRYYKED